jgi:transposase InsO family protein
VTRPRRAAHNRRKLTLDLVRETQAVHKIERYHRSMKNVVRLENYYSPGELERAVARFVAYYNHERLHEAIGNVTPDDMYHGRQRAILSHREKIKRLTLERRKKENLSHAA